MFLRSMVVFPLLLVYFIPEAPHLDTPQEKSDPLVSALDYHSNLGAFVQEREEIQERREAAAETASRTAERSALPAGLQRVRSCESGPWRDGTCGYDLSLYNYKAYNATGCEGQGCYGAYQMHASYMASWAREAGYPGYAYVGFWPPAVQDAVALYKWNATGGRLWCDWADYC